MTSSDRQLLERAAKAVGMVLTWNGDNPPYPRANAGHGRNPSWNPLTDDGDALRLAVTLGMNIAVHYTNTVVETKRDDAWSSEFHNESDRFAATRRAIVRAAASLGEHK